MRSLTGGGGGGEASSFGPRARRRRHAVLARRRRGALPRGRGGRAFRTGRLRDGGTACGGGSGVRPPASEAEGGARRRRGSRPGRRFTASSLGGHFCTPIGGHYWMLIDRVAKTFHSRFGPLKVLRTYCICRPCGSGHFPLDRALGLEGKSATPGAESVEGSWSIHAQTASVSSSGTAGIQYYDLHSISYTKSAQETQV